MENLKIENTKARLKAYYNAEIAILLGQEYQMGNRSLKRADLSEVRKAIKELESEVTNLESSLGGKRKMLRVIPRDL